METPATLPADFFEKHPADIAPKTLPPDFFSKQEGAPPDAAMQAHEQMKRTPMQPSYSAMAISNMPTGADPHNPGNPNLNAVPTSERGRVNDSALATQSGVLAAQGLFSPSTITKAGPLVPGGRAATGRMLPWVRSQVTEEGPSLARKGVSAVVSGTKDVAAWLKANPVKAVAIEGIAHELGVDPIQLARKMIKYGGSAVP